MNLPKVVRHYGIFFRPQKQAQLDWFRNQPSLTAVIEQAALSLDSHGKRLKHQHRISDRTLRQAKAALLLAIQDLQNCSNFDQLHSVVVQAIKQIKGVGKLYAYDVAERIGAKRRLRPERVYLHGGTAMGAKALGLDASAPTIEMSALPTLLRTLPADEVEDILCIYRKHGFDVKSVRVATARRAEP